MIDAGAGGNMGYMTLTIQSNAKNARVVGKEEARNVKKEKMWQASNSRFESQHTVRV